MSKVAIAKELSLIRRRLEAIEETLGEEMTPDDKTTLEEALRDHREGKSIPFKPPHAKKGNR